MMTVAVTPMYYTTFFLVPMRKNWSDTSVGMNTRVKWNNINNIQYIINMESFELAQCIKDAKQEIEDRYQQGELTEDERDFELDHVLGI